MMVCLGVFLFGSNFFGTLWASWTSWKSIFFARLRKFSFIICSNKFSISCCCSSPSGTPIIWILEHFRLSQRFVRLSSLFWILVHSVPVGCLFLPFVPNHWFESWFPSCHCWFPEHSALFHFGYPSFVFFIFPPSSIRYVSILITRDLNSPSDSLAISSPLNSLSGVLLCFSFGPYFFVSVHLLSCKGMGP